MRTEAVVRSGSHEFHIVGTVRGLAKEAERVEGLFHRLEPAALALGVGPEDLEGLHKLESGASYEHDYSEADEVYAHYLQQFGPVELPPRDLVVAVQAATARGLPVVPIDFPEVAYVEAFTKAITGWQLLRYNRRVRRLARKPPVADDAMAFHLWWDRQIGRLAGFAELERQREEQMAARLAGATFPPGRVLVLVEGARVEGLVRSLESRLAPKAHP